MAANISSTVDETKREFVIRYMKCMKNHAVEVSGHVIDGCGEFVTHDDHQSSYCIACGCHKSFHKRIKMEKLVITTTPPVLQAARSELDLDQIKIDTNTKQVQTKFSPQKKDELREFANQIGWKLNKNQVEEEEIMKFCSELEITKPILKSWINNYRKSMTPEQQLMVKVEDSNEIVLKNN
ncbi:hypothetical protein M9H77_24221 [Catharanthus roseus]|uniref:Uncharacterized protein n=1 Tax=Catharanthus roseus TaxID=4058 RepID=A0ACC0AZM5_CATRO|nr:hypothetical protein M9H77_24221 [Catharanthus roseus]